MRSRRPTRLESTVAAVLALRQAGAKTVHIAGAGDVYADWSEPERPHSDLQSVGGGHLPVTQDEDDSDWEDRGKKPCGF
jgi:hypothetical protein